jgi:hypothetical protein
LNDDARENLEVFYSTEDQRDFLDSSNINQISLRSLSRNTEDKYLVHAARLNRDVSVNVIMNDSTIKMSLNKIP